MKPLPEHGECFICGSANQNGLGLRWYASEDGLIHTSFTLSSSEQGPPGHAHGGVLAAILDEIMGTAAWHAGFMVLAANINIDFRLPVPLGVPLTATGGVSRQEGRKVFTHGEIKFPDNIIATVGTGLFIEDKKLFSDPEVSDFLKWLPTDQ